MSRAASSGAAAASGNLKVKVWPPLPLDAVAPSRRRKFFARSPLSQRFGCLLDLSEFFMWRILHHDRLPDIAPRRARIETSATLAGAAPLTGRVDCRASGRSHQTQAPAHF
ncbi:MAG: hypothetical protein OXU94_09110 [Gammaproteobacteria bacterium]|nr:hypothetical protein [Gammaproteobacteria bacterium]